MYWCFTENDCARNFWGVLGAKFEELSQHITYVCGQLEQGSNLHFQGYIQFKRSRALSWVRNNISDTAHWEKQKGSNSQARDYCCKEDGTELPHTFIEFGEFKPGKKGQGARNDLVGFVAAIKEGSSQRELVDTHVHEFAKYIKFHDRVRSLFKPVKPVDQEFKVVLFVGGPGTGKTRKAVEDYPDLFEIPISNGTLWLDGYDAHKVVLFDDFMGAGSKMSLDNTLKFFDRYVRKVPVKGSHAWYMPDTVIVTSNFHPRTWYKWGGREVSFSALARRFTEVWCFVEDGDPEEQIVRDYFFDMDQWPVDNLEENKFD